MTKILQNNMTYEQTKGKKLRKLEKTEKQTLLSTKDHKIIMKGLHK